jgi:hypothetical protein
MDGGVVRGKGQERKTKGILSRERRTKEVRGHCSRARQAGVLLPKSRLRSNLALATSNRTKRAAKEKKGTKRREEKKGKRLREETIAR